MTNLKNVNCSAIQYIEYNKYLSSIIENKLLPPMAGAALVFYSAEWLFGKTYGESVKTLTSVVVVAIPSLIGPIAISLKVWSYAEYSFNIIDCYWDQFNPLDYIFKQHQWSLYS